MHPQYYLVNVVRLVLTYFCFFEFAKNFNFTNLGQGYNGPPRAKYPKYFAKTVQRVLLFVKDYPCLARGVLNIQQNRSLSNNFHTGLYAPKLERLQGLRLTLEGSLTPPSLPKMKSSKRTPHDAQRIPTSVKDIGLGCQNQFHLEGLPAPLYSQ